VALLKDLGLVEPGSDGTNALPFDSIEISLA
jgi:hypothetical protein